MAERMNVENLARVLSRRVFPDCNQLGYSVLAYVQKATFYSHDPSGDTCSSLHIGNIAPAFEAFELFLPCLVMGRIGDEYA